ncbi:hypothetical protein TKK_0004920 [Trichogramma kaykai]
MQLPNMLLLIKNVWDKTLGKFSATQQDKKHQQQQPANAKMAAASNNATATSPITSVAGQTVPTTTTTTMTPTLNVTAAAADTTTAATAASQAAAVAAANVTASKRSCWRQRTVHFTIFLAVFSTILTLLWVYTLTSELRRKAFDVNMMQVYNLNLSMDNPELVRYIRDMQMKMPSGHEPLNATEPSDEEQVIVAQLQGKRAGVYFEYISRIGAPSTTAWLERELGWRGVQILTDPRSFFDACRSSRNPKTRILRSCLSSDGQTKEIAYHQEQDVQVQKLGESPNSLVLFKETMVAPRLICFSLYSVMLAYNTTSLDYLSLDITSEVQDELVLDTIPWDVIRIEVLAIHWASHHSEMETRNIVDKLAGHNYKLVKSLSTGKLVFVYNRRLKI